MHSTDYDGVAELYDVYVTADYDVPFFTREAQAAAGPVLELMAGTGRLSLPLARAGVALTCVDRAPGMLAVLSRELAAAGLAADVRCGDVCDLALEERYPLAILPFQAFMELVGRERQRAALASVFACLRPGGRFVCTMHNPPVRRRAVDGALRVVGAFPHEGGTLVVSGFETGGDPVVSRLQFLEQFDAAGRLAWKRVAPMQFEMIGHDDFEAMAVGAGFRTEAVYGTYDRAPFDAAASPVMIWVLERPA